MSEMALLKQIELELTRRGFRAFRVNVGEGWTGESERVGQDIIIRGARRFSTGLPKGFPDLMVLTPRGGVVFMELKTATGRLSEAQRRFHAFLMRMNQHVCVCRTVEEAIREAEREDEGHGSIQE